eukprot:4086296-Amphidinium_carterae.1
MPAVTAPVATAQRYPSPVRPPTRPASPALVRGASPPRPGTRPASPALMMAPPPVVTQPLGSRPFTPPRSMSRGRLLERHTIVRERPEVCWDTDRQDNHRPIAEDQVAEAIQRAYHAFEYHCITERFGAVTFDYMTKRPGAWFHSENDFRLNSVMIFERMLNGVDESKAFERLKRLLEESRIL